MTPGEWSAWAAWVTVAVLLGSLLFAWGQVTEAKGLREQQSRPFVVLDFDLYSVRGLILVTVENVGHTVAKNVHVEFKPELESSLSPSPLEKPSFLTHGIPTLPPRKRIFTRLDLVVQRFDSDLPMTYDAKVVYGGPDSRSYTDEYTLDLEFYRGQQMQAGKGLDDVAKSLEAIHKELGKLTKGH